jgi:hypothetical protein
MFPIAFEWKNIESAGQESHLPGQALSSGLDKAST